MRYRSDYVNFLKDAPTGSKTKVVNSWRDWVNSKIDVVDPKLSNILDFYFENDNLTEVELD
jgi:hypothetical protein